MRPKFPRGNPGRPKGALNKRTREAQELAADAVRRCLYRYARASEVRYNLESQPAEDLARTIAERMPLYDTESDTDAITALAEKFMELTQEELVSLYECSQELKYQKSLMDLARSLRSSG